MRNIVVVLLILSALLSSCGGTKTYPQLGTVTRIEVRTSDSKKIRTIVEPDHISKIVAFVDTQRAGWGGGNDMFGVPVPRVVLDFYGGKDFKGHFAVGEGFFEMQRMGDFASKSISEQEEQEFLNLIERSSK